MKLLSTTFIAAAFLALGSMPAQAAQPQQEPLRVLMFWGSWCANCPAVMARMEQLRHDYAGRKVEFVAVSLEGENNPGKYAPAKGYNFVNQSNGDALMARYQAVGVPWVVVTDSHGNPIANPSLHSAPRDVADAVKMELDLRT